MKIDDSEAPPSSQPAVPAAITVRQNGRTQRVPYQRGDTLLEAMCQAGITVPFACLQGVCATCMVRLVQGEVALRENHVLTEDDLADGYTLACQGEPRGAVCEIELDV